MRPFASLLSSAMIARMRVTPMPYEPIVTVTSLPFSSSTLSPSVSAKKRPELEHVADLHAARELDRSGSVGCGVAGAHVRDLDEAVGAEVAPGHERVHVLLVGVRAGDPRRAVDDPRVEQDTGCRSPTPRRARRPSATTDRCSPSPAAGAVRSPPRWPAPRRPARTPPLTRLSSMSRSPGSPTITSSRVPSRWVRASTTFLSVCAAVHSPVSGASR